MEAVNELSGVVGVSSSCDAVGVSRSTFYRYRRPKIVREPRNRPQSHRALSEDERKRVLEALHCPRYVDKAPRQVYASLLDQGAYLCSLRTMYRILSSVGELRERRDQLRHPEYEKPELLATGPNQVWSWDITKLKGPVKWTYYYLYVILDIFSRYVTGWMVAGRESAALAKRLIEDSCQKQDVLEGHLSLHSDRGSSMTSKLVAQLLADLGVAKTHSRPHVPDDNPFSESQLKTMKYRPDFPKRFGCIEDARLFCREFFRWYNTEHYHSGLGLLTPQMVHYGHADRIVEQRRSILLDAYQAHPERFVRKSPQPPAVPEAVWINPPKNMERRAELLTKSGKLLSQNR
ncbi:MAG TPA: IS3 family transposase [Methanolinea sp.]|nr:IS3 family transposase [Methanolinea sp.]